MKKENTLGDLYSFYKNRDYSYETIFNGEMFLAYPKTFNDPYDCFIMVNQKDFEIEYLKSIFTEFVIDEALIAESGKASLIDSINKLQYEAVHEFRDIPSQYTALLGANFETIKQECDDLFSKYCNEIEKLRNRYAMACFTTNKAQYNLAMWAHYADNYSGFCCKFNLEKTGIVSKDEQSQKLLSLIKKVRYVKKFPQIDVKKLLEIPVNEIYHNKYVNNFIKNNLNKKYIQWKYENEYRLIIDKEDTSFVKKIETINGFTIDFSYLKELYIYSNKHSIRKELVISAIAKKYNVKYYTLTLSRGNLELIEDEKNINKHNLHLDFQSLFK